MSDTVKLIIEIPKETYKGIMLGKWDDNGLAFYVKTGTTLDDVKAEIKTFTITEKSEYDIGFNDAVLKCFNVLDNADKTESEDTCE